MKNKKLNTQVWVTRHECLQELLDKMSEYNKDWHIVNYGVIGLPDRPNGTVDLLVEIAEKKEVEKRKIDLINELAKENNQLKESLKNTKHITDFSTKELCDELKEREGVYTNVLDVDERIEVILTGPKIILEVID